MKEIIMATHIRKEKGTGISRRLRKKGRIPAVIYGKKENIIIDIDEKDIETVLRSDYGENAIVNMHIKQDGKKASTKQVFIKEVQHNPISEKILHVDFYQFTVDKPIAAKVPVQVKGEAIGVTQQEGVLDHVLWEIEVECLPVNIPEKIEVDVSKLMIGDAIHVKNLSLADEVKVLTDPEQVVISVVPPKKIEVEEAKPEEEEISEPELIKKERELKEEEGEVKEGKEVKKEEKADGS